MWGRLTQIIADRISSNSNQLTLEEDFEKGIGFLIQQFDTYINEFHLLKRLERAERKKEQQGVLNHLFTIIGDMKELDPQLSQKYQEQYSNLYEQISAEWES